MIPRLAAALVLFLPCSGCWLFSMSLTTVGQRYEIPVSAAQAPEAPVRAWVDSPHDRLVVHYRVKVTQWGLGHWEPECRGAEVGREDRWLSISSREVLRALGEKPAGKPITGELVSYQRQGKLNTFTLSDEFVARLVSRKSKWEHSGLQAVDLPVLAADAEVGGERRNGIVLDHSALGYFPGPRAPEDEDRVIVHCFLDLPETEGPDELVWALPRRVYRTPAGWAAQSLLPVTIALDLATSPIQFTVFVLPMCLSP